jgi:hypothetical protein
MEELSYKHINSVSGGFNVILRSNLPARIFIDTESPRYSGFPLPLDEPARTVIMPEFKAL